MDGRVEHLDGFYEALGWELDGATREKTFAGSTFTEVRYRAQVPG